MNVLSGLLLKKQEDGTFRGIRVSRAAPAINHLIYVDDILFFFKADLCSIEKFLDVFDNFGKTSGLVVNPCKCEITFSPNTPNRHKRMMSAACKFKKVDTFVNYLGSCIDEPPRSRRIFDIILDKLNEKLKSWKANLLSQDARVVLIKSVLSFLSLYHLSYFKLTSQEAHKCDLLLSNFFWGSGNGKNSPHMKAWDTICRPKGEGGLGIKKILEFNDALIGKQAWRVISNRDSLLSKIYLAKYSSKDHQYHFVCNSQSSSLVRPICRKINKILAQCSWRVGDGRKTTIGSPIWIPPDSPICIETKFASKALAALQTKSLINGTI